MNYYIGHALEVDVDVVDEESMFFIYLTVLNQLLLFRTLSLFVLVQHNKKAILYY